MNKNFKFNKKFVEWGLRISSIVGLIVIGSVFGISIFVFKSEVATAIITAGATIFVSVSSAIKARIMEKERIIQQQIREKKVPIYESMMIIAFDIIFSEKETKEKSNQKDLQNKKYADKNSQELDPVTRLRKITPEFILWASDGVISSWTNFRKIASDPKQEDKLAPLYAFEDFMFEVRKDLGHENENLDKKSLLHVFAND